MTVPRGLLDGPIYLDYNATTPINPAVAESMLPYLTAEFGNPSSTHHYGRESRIALDHARDQVAALLGVEAERIVFTGSGSEADNLAIRGAVLASGVGVQEPVLPICSQRNADGPPVKSSTGRLAR